MKKTLHILAQAWSILLYPVWMPLFGLVMLMLALANNNAYVMPLAGWLLNLANTLITTVILPIIFLRYSIRKGKADDMYITRAEQRTPMYLFTTICYAYWCMSEWGKLPTFFMVSAIGATVALGLVMLINTRWKISAHLCGFAGLIGGVLSFYLEASVMPPTWLMVSMLLAALLLMYARLYLCAHTQWQVIAGMLLGLTCTFIPNWIRYYVQAH